MKLMKNESFGVVRWQGVKRKQKTPNVFVCQTTTYMGLIWSKNLNQYHRMPENMGFTLIMQEMNQKRKSLQEMKHTLTISAVFSWFWITVILPSIDSISFVMCKVYFSCLFKCQTSNFSNTYSKALRLHNMHTSFIIMRLNKGYHFFLVGHHF